MSLLLETSDKPDFEIKKLLAQTISNAQSYWGPLKYEGPYPQSGFGIGILRPYTVGLSQHYWSASVTTSWADWVSHTLGDNEYVVVTGIMNLTPDPSITAIQPKANGLTLPVVEIEELSAFEQGLAYLPSGFAVKPNNLIVVQIVGRTAQTERFGLVGYEIAKRSFLINQTP